MHASPVWEHACESITLFFYREQQNCDLGKLIQIKILGSMFKNDIKIEVK